MIPNVVDMSSGGGGGGGGGGAFNKRSFEFTTADDESISGLDMNPCREKRVRFDFSSPQFIPTHGQGAGAGGLYRAPTLNSQSRKRIKTLECVHREIKKPCIVSLPAKDNTTVAASAPIPTEEEEEEIFIDEDETPASQRRYLVDPMILCRYNPPLRFLPDYPESSLQISRQLPSPLATIRGRFPLAPPSLPLQQRRCIIEELPSSDSESEGKHDDDEEDMDTSLEKLHL